MLIWKTLLSRNALEATVSQASEGLRAAKKQSTSQEDMLDALIGVIEIGVHEKIASTAFSLKKRLRLR